MTSETLQQALQQCQQQLQQAGLTDSPALDCELLLMHSLQQPRSYLYTWPEKPLTSFQQQQLQSLMTQRAAGHPIAHLLGEKEFWGLPLKVTPDTLIPRPETELLVETALNLLQKKPKFAENFQNPQSCSQNLSLLDLGTGTGAIALALASELPNTQITATDFSPHALQIAQLNAQRLNLPVQFAQGSWFEAVEASQAFDLICSNPPYIDPNDPHLTQGDVRFDPLTALTAEKQGLAELETIIHQAPSHLNTENGLGWLLVEHGYDQKEAVQHLFQQAGFHQIETLNDYADHPRITLGQLS